MSEPASMLLSRRRLLVATAIVELGSGIVTTLLPAKAIWLLFGVDEVSSAALATGRLYGTALSALGIACWRVRDTPARGVIAGMLVYNVGACSVLPWIATMDQLSGILLWPAVLLHAALTLWCVRVRTS